MNASRPTILQDSIRSFFHTVFVMTGVAVGLIPFILIIGLVMGAAAGQEDLPRTTKAKVLPGADGTRTALTKESPLLLQVNVTGVIGMDKMRMDKVRTLLTESREGDLAKDRVKGILLNIRTPGGTVVDSDGIHQAILEYKKRYNVPVYAYVDGLCASGGVYVAAAADRVLSSDVSLIGSVGVIGPSFLNMTGLLEKIGVESRVISAGKGKDAMNPLRPWEPNEEQPYRDLIENYYQQFVDLVVNARPKIEREQLIEEYGAHVFPAAKALEIGFVDEIVPSVQQAIDQLAHAAEIQDSSYQVIELAPKNAFMELFDSEESLLRGQLKHQLALPQEAASELTGQFLYLYHPASQGQ